MMRNSVQQKWGVGLSYCRRTREWKSLLVRFGRSELQKLQRQLVIGGILSEAEFWATRKKLLEQSENKEPKQRVALKNDMWSLKSLSDGQAIEHKDLIGKCAHLIGEIRTLKELAEKMQRDNQEREIILDMFDHQIYDNRESEKRAHAQGEILRAALNEHHLELIVKTANEAEAACQQRLSATEAEIAELREELDASDRGVL